MRYRSDSEALKPNLWLGVLLQPPRHTNQAALGVDVIQKAHPNDDSSIINLFYAFFLVGKSNEFCDEKVKS